MSASVPVCPNCNQPITRALDMPYGWWEWNGEGYVHTTQATRVDMAPWVHADCMGELRNFHPHDNLAPRKPRAVAATS
jgi:hypothetical protein